MAHAHPALIIKPLTAFRNTETITDVTISDLPIRLPYVHKIMKKMSK